MWSKFGLQYEVISLVHVMDYCPVFTESSCSKLAVKSDMKCNSLWENNTTIASVTIQSKFWPTIEMVEWSFP